jgi:signal transduction histidine kinase
MVHCAVRVHDESMPPLPARPASARRAVGAWFPRGGELLDRDFALRHRAVRAVLAAHVPVLAALMLSGGHGLVAAAAVAAMTGGVLVLSSITRARRASALAASAGLLFASGVLNALYGGAAEAHVFVVVVVLALYQDWAVFAVAVGAVLVHHGLVAQVTASAVNGHPERLWSTAVLHSAFVAGESLALALFTRANRLTRSTEQQVRTELRAGRSTMQAQQEATDRMRADLIATVSHEFRTPLTGIRGAALTLLKRGDRLDKDDRDRLLLAVLDQQERLSRLLENILVAAQATDADLSASAEVDAVAAEVAMLAAAGRAGSPGVSVVVTPGTTARIERQALHQVLANLVDNALTHGAPGSMPLIAGGEDERGVWLTVSNEGRAVDLTCAGRLFEPFTQVDSGATRSREGIGVGLYVVRRLVEVHGGTVQVHSDSGWVTVEVRLQAAGQAWQPRRSTVAG